MAYYRDPKKHPEDSAIYCDHCAVIGGLLAFQLDEHGEPWHLEPWRWSPFDSACVCTHCGEPCGSRRIYHDTKPANIV